jgi:hypothetical protein
MKPSPPFFRGRWRVRGKLRSSAFKRGRVQPSLNYYPITFILSLGATQKKIGYCGGTVVLRTQYPALPIWPLPHNLSFPPLLVCHSVLRLLEPSNEAGIRWVDLLQDLRGLIRIAGCSFLSLCADHRSIPLVCSVRIGLASQVLLGSSEHRILCYRWTRVGDRSIAIAVVIDKMRVRQENENERCRCDEREGRRLIPSSLQQSFRPPSVIFILNYFVGYWYVQKSYFPFLFLFISF